MLIKSIKIKIRASDVSLDYKVIKKFLLYLLVLMVSGMRSPKFAHILDDTWLRFYVIPYLIMNISINKLTD